MIGFFNQVATLYANEDIAIQVSAMYVWTSPDPYTSYNSPSAILGPFRTNRGTSFNGNIAHFLTTRNIGGGVAYVDALCNKAYAYGVSRIYTTYSNVPVYSWTINVVAHELGHTVASPHTHSCSWSGGALDNCAAPEGTCSPGPAPSNGGTVMSYCHMTSYGINFNNGFGTQPGNLLRSRVQNATCLPVEAIATPPSNLTTTNITSTSATLNWSPAPGANTYTVQYKLATATTWTSAGTTTTTSKAISGLTAGSNYVWTVKADCSPFAANATFATSGSEGGCSPPTGLSTTSITQTGATLNWGAVSGATSYTLQYKTSSATTWTTVTSTTTSRAITGLSAGTSYVWQVKANCSGYSTQVTFTTTSSSGCSAPTGLSVSSITQTGATLSWSPVSGATSYTLQYKVSTASTWTTVTTTTSSRVLSGLVAGTNYVWQVKANCSAYSAQSNFTTASSSGCAAPANLNTTSIYQTGATLSWSPVSGATSYTVQYKPATGTTWTTVTSTTTSRTLTGLSSGTNYVWKVKANCSPYSAQVTFTTTGSISGCNAPTNLNTINITTNSATLTWTGPSNAQYYTIRIKPVGFGTWTTYNYITGSSFQVGNLQSRRSYEWYIRTRCTNGLTSSYSPPRTFTTL